MGIRWSSGGSMGVVEVWDGMDLGIAGDLGLMGCSNVGIS